MLHVPVRICFVCSGNICRSPTAQVALARQAERAGMTHVVEVDSAGTGGWHVGDEMDPRSRRAMVHAGWDVPAHAARQFEAADFAERDLVVALDTGHVNALWWLAAQAGDTDANRAKIVLLRAFDPQLGEGAEPEVGDPYYGGVDGFTDVLAQIERSCAALLVAVREALAGGVDLDVPQHAPPA